MKTKTLKISKSKNKKKSRNLTNMSKDPENQKDKKTNTNRILMAIGQIIYCPLLKSPILIRLRKKWVLFLLKRINKSKQSRRRKELQWVILLLFTIARNWNSCGKSSFKTKSFTEIWCFPELFLNSDWFMFSFSIASRRLLKLKSLKELVEFYQQKIMNSKVDKYIIALNQLDENNSNWE